MPSKRFLFIVSTIFLLIALASPICFPEGVQVLFARFYGAETLLYPSEINLGASEPGATSTASFRAYNFTSTEIEITDAITTCGCVTHEVLPKMIPAHGVVELTIAVRLPKYKPDFDQSVTYLISESRGMAMRKARILATIPDPLPIPEEGIAPDVENEIPKEPSNGGDVIESNVSDVQMIETSVEENLSDSELEPEIVDENVQNGER